MAVVTWPLSSAEARGHVDGLVYNVWRGRNYVKSNKTPKIEFSDNQIAARAVTARCTAAWQSLSSTDRQSWDSFANEHLLTSWTGTPKRISSYNWFVKLGWYTAQYWDYVSSTPPTALNTYLFRSLGVVVAGGYATVSWEIQLPDPIDALVVRINVEGPYPGPRTPNWRRARYATSDFESAGGITLNLEAPGWYYIHVRSVLKTGSVQYADVLEAHST